MNPQSLAYAMASARLASALLPVLLVLTAGCLALDPGSPGLLTAREAVAQAGAGLPAAATDAALVKATALGYPQATGPDQPALTLDGRASTWLTTWWDQGNATGWQVAVLPGPEVRVSESNGTPYTTEPVATWSVGSQAALEACLEDARFEEIAGMDDGLVSLDLYAGSEGPRWTVMATSQAQEATRIVEIDARNGTLIGPGYDDQR